MTDKVISPVPQVSTRRLCGVEEASRMARIYVTKPPNQFLGASLSSLSLEEAVITFTTTDKLLNPFGSLHASAMYAALELAVVAAAQPHVYVDEAAPTVQSSVSIVNNVAGAGNEIIVKSSMIRRNASMAFFESHLYDAKSMTPLATGKAIKAIRKINGPLKL